MKEGKSAVPWLAFGSLGVVFGDIGTSPIYTLKQAVQDNPDALHVHAAVSLVVWYLLLIVTLKYVYFLLKLNNQGEGGVFALLALAKANAPKQHWLFYTLIVGAALLYGDGMITPAISVLSAVEGLAPPGDGTAPCALRVGQSVDRGLDSRRALRRPALWHSPDRPGLCSHHGGLVPHDRRLVDPAHSQESGYLSCAQSSHRL